MLDLEDLQQEADEYRDAALSAQLSSLRVNPPKWTTFAAVVSGIGVVLQEPVQDNGLPYLLQGAGSDEPRTQPIGTQAQGSSVQSSPIFFYQVQLADDLSFSGSNVTTHDLGTSRSGTLFLASGTKFGRARARLGNGPWSDWRPASGSATVATSINATINTATTSSTTFVDYADATPTTLQATLTPGGKVLIIFSADVNTNTAGVTIKFQLLRDAAVLATRNFVLDTVTATGTPVIAFVDNPVSGVSHTYKLQWKTSIGASVITGTNSLLQTVPIQ